MGDLKDQLLKSGLISDARAKELAHSEKSRRKKHGKKGAAREQAAISDARRERDETRRRADRRRAAQERSEREIAEARDRLRQILQPYSAPGPWHGPRRFHFVTGGGKILFVEVSDDAAKKLEKGELAICEIPAPATSTDPASEWALVPRERLAVIRDIDPGAILFSR